MRLGQGGQAGLVANTLGALRTIADISSVWPAHRLSTAMNRFRTRRRAKEAGGDPDASSVPYLSGKTFRRNKKLLAPKPDLDLANALPSTDNFRTSLLMPKLSARFSMLREQDDPLSKIGKASDDSVIFKRASRLADLLDIPDEASIRPPFAAERSGSCVSADGYATDDDSLYHGSVLGRARPGEGNNLFGGRQKVYKIPAGASGSTKDLNGSGARFLYEHDVHSSAFRIPRPHRRPESRDRDEDGEEALYGHGRKRETSSSIASAPSNGRGSTAATSVTSQGVASASNATTPAVSNGSPPVSRKPEKAPVKSRRLYEQGLDQHMYEQQSSALNRLDHLSRHRGPGAGSPPPDLYASLSHANSTSSLRERYDQHGPLRPNAPASRTVSPSPPPTSAILGSFNFGLGETKSPPLASRPYCPQSPPLSPVDSDHEDAVNGLSSSILSRSKANAMAVGAFAKPSGAYDEHQYSQRQLQMQRGRMSPLSRMDPLPSTGVSVPSDASHGRAEVSPLRESEVIYGRTEVSPLRESGSESSTFGHTRSSHGVAREHEDPASIGSPALESPLPSHGTFLATFSGSDVSSVTDSETEGEHPLDTKQRRSITTAEPKFLGPAPAQPSEFTYAAGLTHGMQPIPEERAKIATVAGLVLTQEPIESVRPPSSAAAPLEGDLSDPPAGPHLSGLVRQHLRSDSAQSTLQGVPAVDPDIAASVPIQQAEVGHAEPTGHSAQQPAAPLAPVTASICNEEGQPSEEDGRLAQVLSDSEESKLRHVRNASSETQRERAEFAKELAQRRRMVQENLKSFADNESRAASPTRNTSKRISPSRTPSSFSMLKSKPSATFSTSLKPDTSTKAMKMLGITVSDVAGDQGREKKPEIDRMKQEEEKMLRSMARGQNGPQPQMRNWGQIRRDARRELEKRQRENKEAGRHGANSQTPSPPSSSSSSTRTRSGSNPSGGRTRPRHSPSGEKPYHGAPKGVSSIGVSHDPPPRPLPQSSARRSPHEPSNVGGHQGPPSEWPRFPRREPTQEANPQRVVLPHRLETVAPLDLAPRPSPIAPYSANSTPLLVETPVSSTKNSPTREWAQSVGTLPMHCKKVVQKSDISEPTLVSSTSNISTVNLPPGASLSRGTSETLPPPVPPINPRRRTRTQQAMLNVLGRGPERTDAATFYATSPASEEEKSTFSDDDSPAPKPRLWKPSSEGGHMNARYRHQALTAPSPSVPIFPRDGQMRSPMVPIGDGGMF